MDILKAVKHPYIVQCYDVEETESKVYLFMELMSGGELFDRIVDKGHFTEKVRRAPRCAARRAPRAWRVRSTSAARPVVRRMLSTSPSS